MGTQSGSTEDTQKCRNWNTESSFLWRVETWMVFIFFVLLETFIYSESVFICSKRRRLKNVKCNMIQIFYFIYLFFFNEMIYSYLFLLNAFKQASSVFWRDTPKMHEIYFIFQFWISFDIQFQKLLCLCLISQSLLEFWLLCFWKVVAEPRKDARILSLWRSRIQSRARDEAWLLRAFMQ